MRKYRIEITGSKGKNELNLEGCISIAKYETDKIVVKLDDIELSVLGKGLSMPVMVDKSLCIKGFIKSLELGRDEK